MPAWAGMAVAHVLAATASAQDVVIDLPLDADPRRRPGAAAG
jgi:hypothetical protein